MIPCPHPFLINRSASAAGLNQTPFRRVQSPGVSTGLFRSKPTGDVTSVHASYGRPRRPEKCQMPGALFSGKAPGNLLSESIVSQSIVNNVIV